MDKENRPKRKAGRPKKWMDGRPEQTGVRIPHILRDYLDEESKKNNIPMSDLIVMAIELMKHNGVIIERKIIRGDHAATPAPDGD